MAPPQNAAGDGDGVGGGAGTGSADDVDPEALVDVEGLVADLEAARDRRAEVARRIESHGEDRVEAVADAHDRATTMLDRYEGSATGTGDFQAYVEFQGKFADLVEDLPGDLPARDAFERANERMDQRRLSESDFDRAREDLAAAADVADLLEERRSARDRLRRARRAIHDRLDALQDREATLERLTDLGEADLDAPVARLRDPVRAYDDAVREAFREFRREASARAVLRFVAKTEAYPLVDFDRPPADLRDYLETHPAGDEPIPTLLDYADYTGSKLAHYIDDVGAFRTAVPMNRTYLDRLDADPLLVGWPPPSAARLRYLAAELVPVVARFADESVVARARSLRDLAERDDYGRLRDAAVAAAELSDAERARLERGDVADELAAIRDARERLRAALADED